MQVHHSFTFLAALMELANDRRQRTFSEQEASCFKKQRSGPVNESLKAMCK